MSRTRTVKPSFFRSRSLAQIPPSARLTFIGLWCEADDAGRGVADPRILKGAIWPLDDEVTHDDVAEHLTVLHDTGHIMVYEVDGGLFYAITRWLENQAPAFRRGVSKLPEPPVAQLVMQESASCTTKLGDKLGKQGVTCTNTDLHDLAQQGVQESAGLDGIGGDGIGDSSGVSKSSTASATGNPEENRSNNEPRLRALFDSWVDIRETQRPHDEPIKNPNAWRTKVETELRIEHENRARRIMTNRPDLTVAEIIDVLEGRPCRPRPEAIYEPIDPAKTVDPKPFVEQLRTTLTPKDATA